MANDQQQMFGFGLNRFCAQQFADTKNIPLYWMVDDNVVQVDGISPDLTRVEGLLERDNLAALSFKGAAQKHIVDAGNSKQFNLLGAQAAVGVMACENAFMEQVYIFHAAGLGDL